MTLRWLRIAATGLSISFVMIGAEAIRITFSGPKTVDFLSYWAAARLVITDRIGAVYNIAAHRSLELSVAPVPGWLPFPYPPPFLLLVTPFGQMSYPAAFASWLVITYMLFVVAAALAGRRQLLPFALAHPGVVPNFLIGQNGFLTSSLFMTGSHLLSRNPILGGAILGLLVIKPQLGVAIPFALIAGREWKAVAGAAISSIGALVIAGLVLGVEAFNGFLNILPAYANSLAASQWPWNEMASTFAALRFMGIPQGLALAIHVAVAAIAIIVTCRAWWNHSENQVPTLAAATILIPPYLFTYDSLFLALPMIAIIRKGHSMLVLGTIWGLCLLPITTYFDWYPGPNTVPLAALLCLWMLNAPLRSKELTTRRGQTSAATEGAH